MRMVHHEKRTTWHGSVTVFFSLTGVLILCLLLAVVEAVRIQGAKAQTASLEGVANFSVLAEYEKNLLEEFEIFALDGAGGSGSFQIQKSEGRLRHYLKANTDPLSGEGGFGLFDPWRLMLTDCEIQGYALLTDEQGEPFYQQVVAYMKATPQLLADKFPQADTGTIRELKVLGEQYERRQEENDKELDVLEAEKKKQEAEKQQEASEAGEPPVKDNMSAAIPVKNPLIALVRLKRRGTLALVTGGEHVSTTTIPTGAFPSRRHLQNGNLKLEKKNQGMAADALFREYLLMQFPNYCKEAKEELKYQAEYLISGTEEFEIRCKTTALFAGRIKLSVLPAASKSDWGGRRARIGTDRYVWNAGADRSDAACPVAWTGLWREPAGCPDPAVRREDPAFKGCCFLEAVICNTGITWESSGTSGWE